MAPVHDGSMPVCLTKSDTWYAASWRARFFGVLGVFGEKHEQLDASQKSNDGDDEQAGTRSWNAIDDKHHRKNQ